MDELLGQQLGKYTIDRMLGRGGMAAVFLAHDASMDRQVAIKVLPREFAIDPAYVKRFEREVKTIAKLNHPNIVPVFDYGEADNWTYIVMAYMPGGTLHGRIRKMGNTIPLETIASVVEQIGSGVDYAHAQGVIHRDFKPANVLVSDGGHLSLSDFGIAKVAENTGQLTGTGMLGTPAYMAPELANRGGLSKRVDVYAVGVTLYELVTGSVPFEADTPMGQLMAHMATPVPDARYFRTDLPDDVQAVIERAMAKDPTQRYQSAGEIAADLRYVVGTSPAADPFSTEGIDDGSTFDMSSHPRTPSQPTARPVIPANVRTRPAAAQTMPAATGRKANLGLTAGIAALVVAIGVGALVLTGTLAPRQEVADITQPAADAPTATVSASATTPVSVIPTLQTFGPVEVLVKGGGGLFKAATGSRPLDTGDTVRVGTDGVALLTLATGVSVELHPGAEMTIDRVELSNNTVIVELTQNSGVSYHYLNADASGLARDYTVHTPYGTAHAVGTRFWTAQRSAGWLYAPSDGSITLEVGASDDNGADNYTAEAANEDCLLVDSAEHVTDCDFKGEGLTPITDGKQVMPSETDTPMPDTPTPVVDNSGPNNPPTATLAATSTACAEQYYCSTDPSQKGTLVHERADCSVELLPGNPQCAKDLGGGGEPTSAPGCGQFGDGGWACQGSFYDPITCASGNAIFCTKYDLCGNSFALICCDGPC